MDCLFGVIPVNSIHLPKMVPLYLLGQNLRVNFTPLLDGFKHRLSRVPSVDRVELDPFRQISRSHLNSILQIVPIVLSPANYCQHKLCLSEQQILLHLRVLHHYWHKHQVGEQPSKHGSVPRAPRIRAADAHHDAEEESQPEAGPADLVKSHYLPSVIQLKPRCFVDAADPLGEGDAPHLEARLVVPRHEIRRLVPRPSQSISNADFIRAGIVGDMIDLF